MTNPDPSPPLTPEGAPATTYLCTCGARLTCWAIDAPTLRYLTEPWLRTHTGPHHHPATERENRAARARKAAHMTDRSLRECRRCHQPIRFVTTEDDRNLPIDPEPAHGGTVLIAATRAGIRARELNHRDAARLGGALFIAHRTTCTKETP